MGPGTYFDGKKKSHSVNHIRRITGKEETLINNAVQRSTLFDIKDSNPGPGQYKTNYYGMSHQLQKMLLRKQATDVFPKEKRIVFDNKEAEDNPGPTTYQTPARAKKSQSKLWKKAEVVNLKVEEGPTPSCADYANTHHTIEEKIKQMNSKLILTEEKPFNCGT